MPKYYRFRVTSPPRKANSIDDKKGMDLFRNERSQERDLTPTQLWYLRRTAWREAPLEPLACGARTKPLSAAAVARLTAAAAAGHPIFITQYL